MTASAIPVTVQNKQSYEPRTEIQAEAKQPEQLDQQKAARTKALADVHARLSWALSEVVVEVEHENDEYGSDPDDEDALPAPDERRRRILQYASEVFRRQHRLFVFVISVDGDNAQLIRLDRAGANARALHFV